MRYLIRHESGAWWTPQGNRGPHVHDARAAYPYADRQRAEYAASILTRAAGRGTYHVEQETTSYANS